MNCLMCNAMINWQPSILDLLSFRRLEPPKICHGCAEQFCQIRGGNLCQGCGRARGSLCDDCQKWQKSGYSLLGNRSIFRYNAAMKEFMHRYKFQGDYRLRLVFLERFSKFVREMKADVVIPIPVTPYTMQTRGFNQVIGLLDCPYDSTIIKTVNTQKTRQSQKGRKQRLLTEQPFMLTAPQKIQDKRVLLVDDVYTTGRTLYHEATLCEQAGCLDVCSATLAS